MESLNTLTLSELNEQVQQALAESLPDMYWIRAETSDVRANASSGHCYLEFVEKDPEMNTIVAKARGTVWSRTFHLLKPYFEQTTGQPFASGLKVLVKVSVEFHKLYGYSLTVHDIDPSYTLGDLVMKRMEIIRRLEEEGIFDLNKELLFPELPQRIALITSPTAAGYEDFQNQLMQNKAGYQFYIRLFPAVMQGEKTEASIIQALDQVAMRMDDFDLVVLIRGGGAASELNCFDSYTLAAHCAQFPLPIVTGIGHDRDDSIVDLVANTRLKTPTAVAAYFIERMDEQAYELDTMQQQIALLAAKTLTACEIDLHLITSNIPSLMNFQLEKERNKIQTLASGLSLATFSIEKASTSLKELQQQIEEQVHQKISNEQNQLELISQFVKMASPEYILQKGYTITLKKGKIVKQASELASGDEFVTRFADGEKTAIVK